MDGLKARLGMCPLPHGPSGLTFAPELRAISEEDTWGRGNGEGQLSCTPPVYHQFFMATGDAEDFGPDDLQPLSQTEPFSKDTGLPR